MNQPSQYSYCVITHTQDGVHRYSVKLCTGLEQALEYLEIKARKILFEEYRNHDKVKLEQFIHLSKRSGKFFCWLWKRRNHYVRIWIKEAQDELFEFDIDETFIKSFDEVDGDTY